VKLIAKIGGLKGLNLASEAVGERKQIEPTAKTGTHP
jgi:hypothetical protein